LWFRFQILHWLLHPNPLSPPSQPPTPTRPNQTGETQESILKYAALAAKWKEPPRDALDTLVLTSAKLDELKDFEQIDFLPFDPTIKRTEGTLRGPDGKVFKTTKGAPHIILKLVEVSRLALGRFGVLLLRRRLVCGLEGACADLRNLCCSALHSNLHP